MEGKCRSQDTQLKVRWFFSVYSQYCIIFPDFLFCTLFPSTFNSSLPSEVGTKFVALKPTNKITISCILIFWQHTRRLTKNYSFTGGRMQGMGWGIFAILFMHKTLSAGLLARKPLLFSHFISLPSKFKGNLRAFSIINVWRDANNKQSIYYFPQDHSTCFRSLSHPSSGVHETVVTATGTSHISRWVGKRNG